MRTRPLRSLSVTVLICTLSVACGEVVNTTATSVSGAGPGGGGQAQGAGGQGGSEPIGPAEVRFFVDDRPHDMTNAEVEATEGRWSDPVRIVVEGLAPGRRARIDVSTEAWAVFVADSEGRVDLGRDAPEEGTWTEADVDGPFWSAPQAQQPIFDVVVTVTDEETSTKIAEASYWRRPVNIDVDMVKVNEGTRVGIVARPKGASSPLPAVLAFGGSEGGTWYGEFMAYHLAQLGYVAFGAGYFGAPGLPQDLESVPLEILSDDLDYLASLPGVDPDRIAVLGASRGGELALLLGAHYTDRVSAVIAQVPSGYVWGSTTALDLPAWTIMDKDVVFVPSSGAWPDSYKEDGNTYYVSTPAFLKDIAAASPADLAAATIPVGATSGPVLLLAGEDDKLWPSCALADVAWNVLMAAGHVDAHGDERHCFPNAGHLIALPPGSSTQDSVALYDPGFGAYLVMGGTPAGIAKAERQGNNAIRAFLERALAKPSN
jgi:dienelactone hydrolase